MTFNHKDMSSILLYPRFSFIENGSHLVVRIATFQVASASSNLAYHILVLYIDNLVLTKIL